jgi:hypothetical protein
MAVILLAREDGAADGSPGEGAAQRVEVRLGV